MADGWRGEPEAMAETLGRAGKPTVPLLFADGGRLLVLPGAGRVLGLWAPGSGASFLWANPALATPEATAAYYTRDGWPNPGGDRTWLAPEIELFIGDLSRPGETYAVPRALDPGKWKLASASDEMVRLSSETRLQCLRSGGEVEVRLGKRLSPADNPLLGTAMAGAGLHYAGYTQVTTLEVEPRAGTELRLGLWNLLQLPPPGVMLIPTRERVEPRQVFGALSPGELTVEPRRVRWAMGGPGVDAKIALRAVGLTGRAGYLREDPEAGSADLVVREFGVAPEGDYVDALWEPPHETGWVFQACCVRGGEERFHELEYHAPAVRTVAGANVCRDESRVWAFRGPSATITAAAQLLVGH